MWDVVIDKTAMYESLKQSSQILDDHLEPKTALPIFAKLKYFLTVSLRLETCNKRIEKKAELKNAENDEDSVNCIEFTEPVEGHKDFKLNSPVKSKGCDVAFEETR